MSNGCKLKSAIVKILLEFDCRIDEDANYAQDDYGNEVAVPGSIYIYSKRLNAKVYLHDIERALGRL